MMTNILQSLPLSYLQLTILQGRVFISVLFVVFLFLTGWTSNASANVLEDMSADFIAHFDKSIKVDSPPNITFKQEEGRIIADGVSGKALSLTEGDFLTVPTNNIINSTEGTMMLWVRPHQLPESTGTHMFVSFGWVSPKSAYFVLSKGWWESHGGSDFTYFVGNNEEATNMAKQVYFNPGKWVHISCTWKTGVGGFSRLYINGYLVAQRNPEAEGKQLWHLYTAGANLFIGSDKGTGDLANNRWADSDIDEFAVFKRALKDDEIYHIYESFGTPVYVPVRDENGNIFQSRVMFDEGRGWMTDDGAVRTVSRIKRAGFNVYIPCIWHGQGTRYPSTLAVPEKMQFFSNDPLKRLIDLAHSNGIEVHPWFTVALRQRDFYEDYYDSGTPKNAFNLHKPAFRKFITDLIIDVVRRYDIDGINLDYIRTMGICVSAYCQKDYFQQFGRDLRDDIANPNPDGSMDQHIYQWQEETVKAILDDVKYRAKTIRPGIIVSVNGRPALRPSEEGREDLSWANTGLVDIVFNMDYRNVPDYEYHNYIISKFKEPRKLILLLGNYNKVFDGSNEPRDPERVAMLIRDARNRWPHGVGLYLYQLLTEEQIRMISNGPFKEQAVPYWR